MAEDKRSTHRVRMSGVRVTYDNAGVEVEADAVDMGPGGLFVRTAAPLPVGRRISLEIEVIGEKGPWSVLGRVVWTRDKGEGDQAPPGMGVKLIDADEGVIASLERIVETRERTDPGLGGPGSHPPPLAPTPAPERVLAAEPAARKTPAPSAPRPVATATSQTGAGRWIVLMLLLAVAAVAAYVLVGGFLRPPR